MRFSRVAATSVMYLTTNLLLTQGAFAADPGKWIDSASWGAEVGGDVNEAHVSGPDAAGINTGFKGGLYLGVFAALPIAGNFEFEPELVYVQKHTAVHGTSGGTFSVILLNDFVEAPLLLKYNFPHQGPLGFYLLGGPAVSYMTRATQAESYQNGVLQPQSDIGSEFYKLDVSLIGGAGVKVKHFGVEARYDAGLRNLNYNLNSGNNNFTVRENTFSFLVRWSSK